MEFRREHDILRVRNTGLFRDNESICRCCFSVSHTLILDFLLFVLILSFDRFRICNDRSKRARYAFEIDFPRFVIFVCNEF